MKYLDEFPRRVREIESVRIPLSDGCRLVARIWMPEDADADPVPAILEYIPYRRRDFTAIRDATKHAYYAGHGYAGVRVDMRGTGDSDGLMHDEYTQQELDDAVEVIAWLAAQPWCTGAVGMTGISWGGFNALQVAALRPPALKAIITACSTDDRYADDIHYMGGCLITENMSWASTMFAFNSRPPDPRVVGERWREMWMERLAHDDPWIVPWLQHPHRDGQWKHGSVCEDFSAIECAVYAVGGWADGYSNAIPRLLAGLSCPRRGLVGPWPHAWPNHTVPGPCIGFEQDALRWWDQYLKGIDTGIADEPMYRVWMQESVPPQSRYDERPGRWVAESAWPSPHVESRRLALNAGGIAAEAEVEEPLVHRSPQRVGLYAGEWCPYGYAAEMPLDQRLEDGQSLCFDSAPLDAPLEILGAPVVELALSADRPSAFVAARLNEVAPGGEATLVTYGLLNLTHRDGHEHPEALEPGRRYRVRVRMNDVAHRFPAGHRLRVALGSAWWPRVWPSPEPVTLTVFAGASALVLPVREPRESDAALPPFGEPEAARPDPHVCEVPYQRGRKIGIDAATGKVEVEVTKDRGRYRLEGVDLTYSGEGIDRLSLTGDDPLSARHESSYRITLEREGWHIRTETRSVMTCTGEDFLISATLDAFEGETRVFTRTWDHRVPRKLV